MITEAEPMPLSVREYLQQGPATSREIQTATGLSQTAVSRHIGLLGESIIRLPGGRTPRYALTRHAFGGDDKLPLFMVDEHGNNTRIAIIRPLAHGGFYVQPEIGMPSVLRGANQDGIFDELPYFLGDLRPKGILGRHIAYEMASRSEDFPSDLKSWDSDHVGRYLVSNGDDLPGNFKFGRHAHSRVRKKPVVSSVDDYPELAESLMNGSIAGSSAGGELPKFTTFCGERQAHVIVKFASRGNDPVAQRWRDILITEHLATEAIHRKHFPAAETRLIDLDGWLFLESERFDRSGAYGRMSMVSLRCVDAEFTGQKSHWVRTMSALCSKQLISWQHCFDAQFLWAFGRLINNSEMHLENLSLRIDGDAFRLLPVYDMCSMGFAPKSGELPPYHFIPPDLGGENLVVPLDDVKGMAFDFWERVKASGLISDEFRSFLEKGNPALGSSARMESIGSY